MQSSSTASASLAVVNGPSDVASNVPLVDERLLVEAAPNAYKTLVALRSGDVDNYAALLDISDNSLDADATKICYHVYTKNGHPEIVVADDGSGMNDETLLEALKLGSLTERDVTTDCGKFGVGLILSGISIARRLTVITRSADGCMTGVFDLDVVKHLDRFVVERRYSSESEIAKLDEYVPEGTGTIIWLTKCDLMSNKNTSAFADILAGRVSRVYRHFLSGQGGKKRRCFVNGTELTPEDPLMLADSRTERLLDKEYPVAYTAPSGEVIQDKVRVRMVQIPEVFMGTGTGKKDMQLLKRQGIYVMRNYREIADAETLDIYLKHQVFNRVRIELFFSGRLDPAMGVNNQKQLASKKGIDQSLRDIISGDIRNNLTTIRSNQNKKHRANTDERQQEVIEQAARTIQEKKKFLLAPPVLIEKRQRGPKPRKDVPGDGTPETSRGTRTPTGNAQPDADRKGNFEIILQEMAPSGPIYDCYQQGTVLYIRVNVEHAFYQHFVMNYLDDEGKLPVNVQYIYASMAMAELRLDDDNQVQYRNRFLTDMSSNLTVLLS